jgi:hypothetical protein
MARSKTDTPAKQAPSKKLAKAAPQDAQQLNPVQLARTKLAEALSVSIPGTRKLAVAVASLLALDPEGRGELALLRLFGDLSEKDVSGEEASPQQRLLWRRTLAWLGAELRDLEGTVQAILVVGDPPDRDSEGLLTASFASPFVVEEHLSSEPGIRLAKAVSIAFGPELKSIRVGPGPRPVGEPAPTDIYFFQAELPLPTDQELLIQIESLRNMPRKENPAGLEEVGKVGGVTLTIAPVRGSSHDWMMETMGREQRPQEEGDKLPTQHRAVPDLYLPRPEFTDIQKLLQEASESSPVPALARVESAVLALRSQHFLPPIQQYLDRVAEDVRRRDGANFGSFEENQAFVESLSTLLSQVGARLKCPRPECGRLATLVLKRSNSPTGSFVFQHGVAQRRTNHGGSASLPTLIVVPEVEPNQRD